MHETIVAERYMTSDQVAALLGCGPTHVAHLAQAGKIDAIKVGRDWLLDRAAVEAYAQRPVTVGWKRGRPRRQAT